jgi:hypothetical protein
MMISCGSRGDQAEFYATSEVHYGILKGEISRWADRWYVTVKTDRMTASSDTTTIV